MWNKDKAAVLAAESLTHKENVSLFKLFLGISSLKKHFSTWVNGICFIGHMTHQVSFP